MSLKETLLHHWRTATDCYLVPPMLKDLYAGQITVNAVSCIILDSCLAIRNCAAAMSA